MACVPLLDGAHERGRRHPQPVHERGVGGGCVRGAAGATPFASGCWCGTGGAQRARSGSLQYATEGAVAATHRGCVWSRETGRLAAAAGVVVVAKRCYAGEPVAALELQRFSGGRGLGDGVRLKVTMCGRLAHGGSPPALYSSRNGRGLTGAIAARAWAIPHFSDTPAHDPPSADCPPLGDSPLPVRRPPLPPPCPIPPRP